MSRTNPLKRCDGYDERALLMSAADHLEAVDRLMPCGFRVLDSAGFLAHLVVELMLKAYLLHRVDSFPKTHDLAHLLTECDAEGLELDLEQTETEFLTRLNRFKDLRYPNTNDPVSVSSEDFEVLDQIVKRIASQYPGDPQTVLKNLFSPDPDGVVRKGGRALMIKSPA